MKNAKKSMFITTILMVAVLIVAVSTATFAWYTASEGGTVGTSTLTSAESSSANITIGWMPTDMTTSIADLAPASATVEPAVPVAEFANTNVFAAPQDGQSIMSFNKAAINTDGTFSGAGTPATNDLWKIAHTNTVDSQVTDNKFYVTNRHTTDAAAITMTIVVADTEELVDQLFVAVFVDNVFKGVLNDGSLEYTYGTINDTKPSNPANAESEMETAASSNQLSFTLASGAAAEIQLVAWLDGTTTVDADSAKSVAFGFSFDAQIA